MATSVDERAAAPSPAEEFKAILTKQVESVDRIVEKIRALQREHAKWANNPDTDDDDPAPPAAFWFALGELLDTAAEEFATAERPTLRLDQPVWAMLRAIENLANEAERNDNLAKTDLDSQAARGIPDSAFWGTVEQLWLTAVPAWERSKNYRPETIPELAGTGHTHEQICSIYGWYDYDDFGQAIKTSPRREWVDQELAKPGSITKNHPPRLPVSLRDWTPAVSLANRIVAAEGRKRAESRGDGRETDSMKLYLQCGMEYVEWAAEAHLKRPKDEVHEEWLQFSEWLNEHFGGDRDKLSAETRENALRRWNAEQAELADHQRQLEDRVHGANGSAWDDVTDDELRDLCGANGIGLQGAPKRETIIAKLAAAGIVTPDDVD